MPWDLSRSLPGRIPPCILAPGGPQHPRTPKGEWGSAAISYNTANKQSKSWWGSGLPPCSHAGLGTVSDREYFCSRDFGQQRCPILQTPSSAISGHRGHHDASPSCHQPHCAGPDVSDDGGRQGIPRDTGTDSDPSLLQTSATTSWRWWGWRARWRWGRSIRG